MALMLDGKLAVTELHDKMAKETAKKARMSGTRVVQAYEVIYAGDARLRNMQRNKDDTEKEEAAMEARLKIYEDRFKRIVKSFRSKKKKGLQERSERERYKKRYRLVTLELRRKLRVGTSG
ncbi:hypothetical protein K3495_g8877 [Podosphaera aphanis]|nr:hypothetical protein K3495_g8877 [Podosphaera aphanis]